MTDFETIALILVRQLRGLAPEEAAIELRITATDSRGLTASTTLNVAIEAPHVGQTITGTGTQTVYGTTGTNLLIGGSGNNSFYANGGGDRIVFGIGSGQDVLRRGDATYTSYPLGNTIEFGPGVTLANLTFTRVGSFGTTYEPNGHALLIQINGTSDSLRIEEQFHGAAKRRHGTESRLRRERASRRELLSSISPIPAAPTSWPAARMPMSW